VANYLSTTFLITFFFFIKRGITKRTMSRGRQPNVVYNISLLKANLNIPDVEEKLRLIRSFPQLSIANVHHHPVQGFIITPRLCFREVMNSSFGLLVNLKRSKGCGGSGGSGGS
jgi:hypothetical protein